MAVLKDILEDQPITLGFNRHKDGMDVLSTLDLHVAKSTATSDGIKRHRTGEALDNFAICVHDLTTQVQAHNP